MTDKEISGQVNNRRSYFRLQKGILIGFRPASKPEVDDFLLDQDNIKAEKLDVNYQLDQISRQLSTLLQNIRQESSSVALYLELMNKKIDVIASMLSFEYAASATPSGALSTTETFDISEGGMSFLSEKSLEIDQFVYCKLAIMGYRLGLETFAKVTRVEASADDASHFNIGVEFSFLKEQDRKNLSRFILDKQREQQRDSRDD